MDQEKRDQNTEKEAAAAGQGIETASGEAPAAPQAEKQTATPAAEKDKTDAGAEKDTGGTRVLNVRQKGGAEAKTPAGAKNHAQGSGQRPRRLTDKTAIQPPVRGSAPQAKAATPARTGPNGKRRRKKTVAGQVVLNMVKAGFMLLCVGLIIASIVALQVVQYVVSSTQDDDNILDLDNLPLSLTSYIYAWDEDEGPEGDWVIYQELVGPQHRIWVSLDQVPPYLTDALIATEDRDFETNSGVDLKRTTYALLNEIFGFQDRSFGASTITQQLIKNITGDDETEGSGGYQRKLREIFRAFSLTERYSKDMIMEAYLNTMSLSGTIAGVQAGALEYFNKDVSELTLWECATIAGITRAPTYYSPFLNPDNCLTRRNNVLYFMLQTEKISQIEYEHAIAQPLVTDRGSQTSVQDSAIFSYYSDAVFAQVVDDLVTQGIRDNNGQLISTRAEARNFLYTGGLKIYANVDLKLQKLMEDMYEHGYDEDGFFTSFNNPRTGRPYMTDLAVEHELLDENGNFLGTETWYPQSCAVSLRYDGSVAAVVGGIGPKTESLVLNRAIDGPRQVGSTMKPIGPYAIGVDFGVTYWSDMVLDEGVQPRDPLHPSHNPETGEVINDWPRNFSGTPSGKPVPVVSAISESLNTVAARIGKRVGVEQMYEFLEDTLQISTLVSPQEDPENNDMSLAPLSLGGLTKGISALELAAAYMIFGGDGSYGVYHEPCFYERITDSKGSTVMQHEGIIAQAISEETGYVMNRMLSTVLRGGAPGASPTAGGMLPAGEMDAVAKTGTTTDDRDRWFVGLTPYYVTAVWWGYDEIYDLGIWGAGARNNIPPNVWKTLMEERQADLPVIDFPERPEGVETQTYCTSTGMLAGPDCPGRATGLYTSNGVPDICNGRHPEAEEPPPEG